MPYSETLAVVADADEQGARQALSALETLRIPAKRVLNGIAALRAVEELTPDILLLNASLPPCDGAWLADRVYKSALLVHPAVLISRVPGLRLPGEEELLERGAALLDRPLRLEALQQALAETDVAVRRTSGRIRRRLEELLGRLDLPEHDGRDYLGFAVLMAYQDGRLNNQLTKKLYPMVAERFGVSAKKVETAMRYAIELAWKNGRIEEQYGIFRGTIDAQRGKPTCGEMIAQLSDILRLEEVRV